MTNEVRPPEQRADAWSATALDYGDFAELVTRPFAEDAARLVTIGPGSRVLDVGAGTGNFSLAAARLGAIVLATDFAEAMLDVLRRRATAQGLTSAIDTAAMDGQALELPDNAFDVVASIFGLLFFPDHDRGLRELLRVLVPGGRAVVATWAPPPRGEMSRILGDAMAKTFPKAVPPGPPHWAGLGEVGPFRERMLANGFTRAHVVELRHVWVFNDIRVFTDGVSKTSPPLVAMFASMTPDQRATVLAAIDDDFRARQGDGPYAITYDALVAVGTKGA